MANLALVAVEDVARALGGNPKEATPEGVAAWMRSHYLKTGAARFNYNPTLKAARLVAQGKLPFVDGLSMAGSTGSRAGYRQNAAVFTALEPYLAEIAGRGYPLKFAALKIGSVGGTAIYVGVKSAFAVSRHGKASVVVPNFRKSSGPTAEELGTACSIAVHSVARDDLFGADIECISTPGESRRLERDFVLLRQADLRLYAEAEVISFLSVYLRAVAILAEEGAPMRSPGLSLYRSVDPGAPSLFGGS